MCSTGSMYKLLPQALVCQVTAIQLDVVLHVDFVRVYRIVFYNRVFSISNHVFCWSAFSECDQVVD